MTDSNPYQMTLSLNVLNHLGLNLYSNGPAVLSEVVANSWDADANEVEIKIDGNSGRIEITDDGIGMDQNDINDKYLFVGYMRREEDKNNNGLTLKGRRPMGRKGIGKLSLFSIANQVEVHTIKNGKKNGFLMKLEEIKRMIANKESGIYHPKQIDTSNIEISKGTKIFLTRPKKNFNRAAPFLTKRLARRFSVIDDDFKIKINGTLVSPSDRDYYHKVQYLWVFGGEKSNNYVNYSKNIAEQFPRDSKIEVKDDDEKIVSTHEVHGWIGSVFESGSLKEKNDSINKITILVRGKLAQEDVLESLGESGVYSKFIIGEIHADFLDEDEKDDIATSSRQQINEDDPRYIALRKFIGKELKNIQNKWTNLRNKKGEEEALKIQAIDDWYKTLGSDHKRKARAVFGKINQLDLDEKQKRRLFRFGVLAFEHLKYKQNLDALDKISPDNFEALSQVIRDVDDIEASIYHQIVNARIEVIEVLINKVEEDVLEKVIQEHLYNHLWLLDPSWERATDTPYMERTVKAEFERITNELKAKAVKDKLSKEECDGRLDIKYKTTSGKHVIVELKRAGRVVDTDEILRQVRKYINALRKILDDQGRENDQIETVVLVGKDLKDWSIRNGRKTSDDTLKPSGIRVVKYQELIHNAELSYKEFFDKKTESGRLLDVLNAIDPEEDLKDEIE